MEEHPSQLLPFKHGLLNYDWAPELHVGKFDKEMFIESKQKFSGIYDLIWNGNEAEKLRKKDAKAKKAEAKAKKRKAREEENEKARDESRGRKMDRRDQRNKMKNEKHKQAEEEDNDPERPGGRQKTERRKRPERRKGL